MRATIAWAIRLAGVGLVAASTVALAQSQVVGGQGARNGAGGGSRPAEASADDGAEFRTAPVLAITSVEIMRSTRPPDLDIVRVRGLTSTSGWEGGELVPLTKGTPPDGILDMLFIAGAPSHPAEASGFTPIEAIFAIEPGHPYKGVRVRSASNRISVPKLPGYAEASVAKEDCARCVGRYFVAKGANAPAGRAAGSLLREEDIATPLRVIRPTDGIPRLDPDPNRLTLVLGEDGTVVTAVWD